MRCHHIILYSMLLFPSNRMPFEVDVHQGRPTVTAACMPGSPSERHSRTFRTCEVIAKYSLPAPWKKSAFGSRASKCKASHASQLQPPPSIYVLRIVILVKCQVAYYPNLNAAKILQAVHATIYVCNERIGVARAIDRSMDRAWSGRERASARAQHLLPGA